MDGGLTRDELLLRLQADAAGVPVQRGAVDATAAGSAALAAVGAGLWPATAEIAERIPAGEPIEPAARPRVALEAPPGVARVRGARGGALSSRCPSRRATEGRIAVDERADSSRYAEDVGAKDFKMGATGLLLCAGLAILFAIIA